MTECDNCGKKVAESEAKIAKLHLLKTKLQCVVLGLKILLAAVVVSALMNHAPEIAVAITNLS
ncbi:hypothetical protein MD588_13455 [Photobacterium sp. SDRW27]|uniref:hypothetical protein n=1 Tax=Photobacterium obscurum TaxID=2829490 RepID=UPI002243C592|nr:hypothetical protein [Photobacterium obscurum]MCW8329815.1 hypothetical protein [Photobacterium obscurum]